MCTYSWRVPTNRSRGRQNSNVVEPGGLGATQGPPLTYHCAAPNLMPELLPWLALLALLALKPNRCWSAWWIWLPLACLLAGLHCLQLGFHQRAPGFPNEALIATFSVPCALGFGLAATWLLAPLPRPEPSLPHVAVPAADPGAFQCIQLCGAGKLGRGGWGDGDEVARPAGSGHTGPRGGYALLWLDLPRALRSPPAVPGVVRVPAGGLLCGAVPLAVGEMLTTRGGGELSGLFVCWLFGAAGSFVVLLPFVVLSAANSLFRERIKALCHLECKPAQTMAPTPSA